MAGICSGTHEGTPLLGEGEEEGEVRLVHPPNWFGPLRSFSPLVAIGETESNPSVGTISILCRGPDGHNILWPGSRRTPSNCVIFRL